MLKIDKRIKITYFLKVGQNISIKNRKIKIIKKKFNNERLNV